MKALRALPPTKAAVYGRHRCVAAIPFRGPSKAEAERCRRYAAQGFMTCSAHRGCERAARKWYQEYSPNGD